MKLTLLYNGVHWVIKKESRKSTLYTPWTQNLDVAFSWVKQKVFNINIYKHKEFIPVLEIDITKYKLDYNKFIKDHPELLL